MDMILKDLNKSNKPFILFFSGVLNDSNEKQKEMKRGFLGHSRKLDIQHWDNIVYINCLHCQEIKKRLLCYREHISYTSLNVDNPVLIAARWAFHIRSVAVHSSVSYTGILPSVYTGFLDSRYYRINNRKHDNRTR